MISAKNVLRLALLAGEIMLSNGAETYRVEDTMKRIMSSFKFSSCESFVTTTGIFASIEDENNTPITLVRRVKSRTIHFEKIVKVNELSRNIVEGKINITDAEKQLLEIKNILPYSNKFKLFSSGVACFCFCFIFGGSFLDCCAAFISGFIFYILYLFLNNRKISGFLINIICASFITIITLLLINLKLGDNLDRIIIGSIMPIVPGVNLTNAARDILEGDFLSGSNRIMDTIIVAVSIATGVGTVLKIWFDLFGGVLI